MRSHSFVPSGFGVLFGSTAFRTMASAAPKKTVQVFGRKRAAVAVALCKEGKGLIRVNGQPLHLLEPEVLRVKVRRRLRGIALGPPPMGALSRT